ncbi:MAG: hypothetical protein J5678_00950 [Bacteroidaceae bacterium]|nr:hypothetical protein [Bacteroidaceae bacterium]
MNKVALIILALWIAAVGAEAQKKKANPAQKGKVVQPAVEKKPKTGIIDSLIGAYLFDEATDLIEEELNTQPTASYAAILKARRHQAELGSTMLEATQRVVIIDSVVVGRDALLQTLNLDENCGKLLTAQQLRETTGLSEQTTGTAFINNFGDHLLFSCSRPDSTAQLMERNRFGDKWSAPTPLRGLNDSLATQAFPFLLADGTTLYFAAKDQGSLGGYDIYVTRYNSTDNGYLKPENLGMPFNSPANDYLMAYDELHNLGWFVSDRRQSADKVCIYTFIPAETRETYDDLDEDKLRRIAALHSIKDTQTGQQQAVSEAVARLKEARTARKDNSTKGNELDFDLAYGKHYSSLDDFRNPKAKEQAAEWARQKYRRAQLAELLRENRNKYAEARTDTERKALAPAILRQEQELETQDAALAELANKVRELEQ